MSDSDDFGPLVANTPNIPRAIASKPNGNRAAAVAGPSTIAAGNSNKRKKAASVVEDPSDDDEVQEIVVKSSKTQGQANPRGRRKQQQVEEEHEVVEEDEADEESETNDVQVIDLPPAPTKPSGRKPTSRPVGGGKPESSGVNGNSNAAAAMKGKGKQKAKATTGHPPKKFPSDDAEPMDVDAIEVPDDDMYAEDVEPEVVEAQEILVQAINTAGGSGRVKTGSGKVVHVQHPPPLKKNVEMVRLKEQLRQAQKHIEDLTEQLKELCQVRQTEPELLLERMESQHQVELKAHDHLLKDLMAKVAKKEAHVRTGRTAIFELLTRDEVNKETQALQQQIKTQKEALRDRDKRLMEQDEQIKSLREDVKIADLQLKEEIERGKSLVAQYRQPAPSSRSRTGTALAASSDPKYGAIILFYEDLTNVIVPSMKPQTGKYLGKDDWILNCCYTHKDVVNKNADSMTKSLNFTLRLCWEPKSDAEEPIVNMDQLVQSVHYIPHELHNESPEFVESLGFLGDNFTFERDQLSLFVRTLHDYISGEGEAKAGENSSDDDNSVQIVE